MNAAAPLYPQVREPGLDGCLPSDCGAADNRRAHALLRQKLDSGIAECFPRCDDGKLREAVELGVLAAFEMFQWVEAVDLRAVLKLQSHARDVGDRQRPDPRAPRAKGFPVLREIQAKR